MVDKLVPKCEWSVLKRELFENKPLHGSYPEGLVRKRELLLLSQYFLADYQTAKTRKYKDFFRELYQITMQTYFSW